ncbi:MAG: hypothetical protein U1F25_18850 [Rubrivivax sp.]
MSQSGADGWRLLRGTAQAAADADVSATPDSRLGAQLNWNHGLKWDGALQAVALKRPPGAPVRDSVEWAYVGYRPAPNTRVRLGRTNPDAFLYAESRNVGYALPWVRPPVDFYGSAPVAGVDGLDLEHRWPSGDAQWRARFTAGSFGVTINSLSGNGVRVRARDTAVLGLSREDGGLLIKASVLRTRFQFDAPAELLQLKDALGQLAALPVPGLHDLIAPLQRNLWTRATVSYYALGAQYDSGPWTLITEASNLVVPDTPLGARRGYVSLSYRANSVSYYGLASRVMPKDPLGSVPDLATALTPVIGAQAAAMAQQLANGAGAAAQSSRFDQSTVGVGLRWDFRRNAALKLQVDRFKVHPNGGAQWTHSDAGAARGTLVSAVVDFVWGQ